MTPVILGRDKTTGAHVLIDWEGGSPKVYAIRPEEPRLELLVGPDHRRLFPASILGGAILMVGADMLARTLIAPAEIPIGIITSVLGCPFFLYLLSRRRDALL